MRLAVGVLLVLLSAACGQQSDQGRTLRIGYRAAAVHHFRYHSTMTGTEQRAGSGQKRDDAQRTTDAVWRVVAVDGRGAATIDQTLSDAVGGASWRFTVAPDGLVTGAPAPGVMPVPGSTQFLPVLADRPVRPGDAWKSDVRLTGQAPLHVQNEFARYDTWRGRRVAVLTSRIAGPFELAAGGSSYQGTVGCHSTTWLEPDTGLVAKVDSTVDADFTATARDDPRATASFSGEYRLQLESTDPPGA